MTQETHTSTLQLVREGDTVTIHTSEGHQFEAECVTYDERNAAERTGEIRKTMMWSFDAVEYQPVVTIIQGLRSSADDPDFPIHEKVWDTKQECRMGYVKSIIIHNSVEA